MQPWLVRSGHWIYSTDRTTTPSHVLLSGGKAKIPANMRSDPDSPFLLSMARDVVDKKPIHVVERTFVNGTYRMFADLDIPCPLEASEEKEDASDLLMRLLQQATSCLPGELCVFPIVVCTRKWRDGKIGAHLIWNDGLRVNDDEAMELRDKWIDAIGRAGAGGNPDPDFWKKTIDEAVYRRNGLRMPWALKKNGHPDAAYVPTHVILEDATKMELIEPPIDEGDVHEVAKWLSRASIHAMEPESSVRGKENRKRKAGAAAASPKALKVRRRQSDDDGLSSDSFALSAADASILLEALPKAYGLSSIDDIGTRCKRLGGMGGMGGMGSDGPGICKILVSARSRTCAVAGREHSANHVFFELRKDGRVFQRCHSLKCEGRSVELAGVYHGLILSSAQPIVRPRSGGQESAEEEKDKEKEKEKEKETAATKATTKMMMMTKKTTEKQSKNKKTTEKQSKNKKTKENHEYQQLSAAEMASKFVARLEGQRRFAS